MSLISMLVAARAALANRRQRQRALDELAALDDRSLADIGLHRSHLPAIVAGLHEAVRLDASPAAGLPSMNRRDAGLSPSQQWLYRI